MMFDCGLQNIFQLKSGQSRSINWENRNGEKGKGGMASSDLGPSRKGSPCIPKIEAGETVILGEIQGEGIIQHIWITVTDRTSERNRYVLRDLVLRMYWDDEEFPSVECPLGDFFCCGFGVSYLPGAFIIYRADKEDDELFFANDEFLHMSGYKDIDELFRLTKRSFRNLIREDEQQQIESNIWEQIDNGNENDYIHFHLRKADGSYLSVLDHGRIVESPQYGKVFYVLFMDWEDMHIRYSDKFSR